MTVLASIIPTILVAAGNEEVTVDSDGHIVTHSPILPETPEIIYGGLASLLIFFLLYKFAWPQMKKALAARTAKIQKELGLSPDVGGAAVGDALVVGLSYLGAAVVPLWPYLVLPLTAPALIVSVVCTLVALFALGVAKGRVARQAWQRAGAQVMLIGSASAPGEHARGDDEGEHRRDDRTPNHRGQSRTALAHGGRIRVLASTYFQHLGAGHAFGVREVGLRDERPSQRNRVHDT